MARLATHAVVGGQRIRRMAGLARRIEALPSVEHLGRSGVRRLFPGDEKSTMARSAARAPQDEEALVVSRNAARVLGGPRDEHGAEGHDGQDPRHSKPAPAPAR